MNVQQYFRVPKFVAPSGPWPYSPVKTPNEVSGLHLWYDVSDYSTLTFDGANISQINDKSGNSYHASQPSSGLRPLYEAAGLNGKPCISFDAANLEFLQSTTLGLTTYPVTVFYVIEYGGGGYPWSLLNISSSTQYFTFTPTSSLYFGIQSIRISSTSNLSVNSSISGSPAIICSVASTSTQKLIKIESAGGINNGNFSEANTQPWPNINTLLLGKVRVVSSGGHFTGKISEIFIYNGEPSNDDKNALFNYLANKYLLIHPVAV